MTEADTAVHAHAQAEGDLFSVAGAEQGSADLMIEIEAVLTQAAEVRTKLVGQDKHPVPVLCLDLRPLSGIKRSIHIEQIYTEASRKHAEAKAATLKRGAHVTFRTALADMRITFPHVRSVVLHLEH